MMYPRLAGVSGDHGVHLHGVDQHAPRHSRRATFGAHRAGERRPELTGQPRAHSTRISMAARSCGQHHVAGEVCGETPCSCTVPTLCGHVDVRSITMLCTTNSHGLSLSRARRRQAHDCCHSLHPEARGGVWRARDWPSLTSPCCASLSGGARLSAQP